MNQENKISVYKEILSALRKGDETRHPDVFEEAFNALAIYPELAEWFEQDQSFDTEFRTALEDYDVPEQKPVRATPAKVIRFPLLKVAALVAAVLSVFAVFKQGQVEERKCAVLVEDMRESMAAFAAGSFELDAMNNDLSVLREINVSNGGMFGDALDEVFAKGLPMGCKVVDWDGRNVSLYCFGNDQEQVVHAFVIPVEELNGKRAAKHLLAIKEFSERDTGGFIVGDTAYLLVSSMPGVDIKQFLLPAQQSSLAAKSAFNESMTIIAVIQAPLR